MFQRSTLLIALTLLLVVSINTIVFTSSGQPPAGNTGAPGENTCARSGCHTGNSATATSLIAFDTAPTGGFASGYTPGTSYNLFLNVNALPSPSSSTPRNGFEIVALTAGNSQAGTFTLTNTTLTTKSTLTGREYVGHKNANSTAAWTFRWDAPIAGTGAVTFYVVANMSNNNNSDSGDRIYTQAFTIGESTVDPCANFGSFISTPGGATSFCSGQSLVLTAGATGGGGMATYAWSSGGTGMTETVTTADTYTVTVTDGACTSTSSITVTSVSAGVANFTTSVTDNQVVINNSSTGVNGNYTWDFGDGEGYADNSAAFTYTYAATGTYTITLSYTDVCGTARADSQTVTIATVGVNELGLANVLSVSPNPFYNQASININGFNGSEYQFIMVDITGKMVRNMEGVAGTPLYINRDGLQSGMYFYNLTLNGQTAQGKLLID
jgi:hypothetical protein